jgi:hypothetical protein
LKVKFEGKYGSEKSKDVGRVGLIGSLNGGVNELVEFVVVNAFEVGVVGRAEDSVGDVAVDLKDDGFGGSFFGPNDGLICLVGGVSLVLCIGTSGDGWQCGDGGRADCLGRSS